VLNNPPFLVLVKPPKNKQKYLFSEVREEARRKEKRKRGKERGKGERWKERKRNGSD